MAEHQRTKSALASLALSLLACQFVLGQAPESFRPQAPSDLPSSGRIAGEPGRTETPTPPRTIPRPGRSNPRDSYVRLARAPNMFGDTLPPMVSFAPPQQTPDRPVSFTTLLGGGASYNVAENNTTLPTDRVYFVYNAFYNALQTTSFTGPSPPSTQSVDLHRYLIGFEKTFLDGDVSIDVRMPLTSGFNINQPGFNGDLGNVGNLTMFLKGLLYADQSSAFGAGLGIGLPTGSDFQVQTPTSYLNIKNQSVRLIPFVGMTLAPNDSWFLQSFGQLNFAASGNDVVGSQGLYGVFTEQNLLQFDTGVGRWLWRDSGRQLFSGVAAVGELHYTTTIQDTDVVRVSNPGTLGGRLSNPANRVDLLNLTSGLHFQLGPMSNLRVGAVVPLKTEPDRVFDSELQVFFNRFF